MLRNAHIPQNLIEIPGTCSNARPHLRCQNTCWHDWHLPEGLADVTRHIIGFRFAQETRGLNMNECASMTWRAILYVFDFFFLIFYRPSIDPQCASHIQLNQPPPQCTLRVSPYRKVMLKHRMTPPPQDAYSLHRKLSGAFLVWPARRPSTHFSTH